MKKIYYSIGIVILIGLAYAVYTFFLDEKNKPEKEHMIMALGDSLTYGVGDRDEEGYVGQLEKKLNRANSRDTYKIYNYGIPGQESKGVLKQLANIKISEKVNESDQLILFIGTNDLRTSLGGDFQTFNKTAIERKKAEYLDNIDQILSIIRHIDKDVPLLVVGLYNPYPDDKRLDSIIDKWNRDLKKAISSYSSVTYLPTNDLFKEKSKEKYFSDNLHLNSKGYQLIANRISKKI